MKLSPLNFLSKKPAKIGHYHKLTWIIGAEDMANFLSQKIMIRNKSEETQTFPQQQIPLCILLQLPQQMINMRIYQIHLGGGLYSVEDCNNDAFRENTKTPNLSSLAIHFNNDALAEEFQRSEKFC
jgi:hypothetical protein